MVNRVIPTNMPHPMSAVGWDGTDFHILTIDPAGHLQVDLLSSALPTGAATAANQATEITALQLIDDLRAALHSVNTDELQVNVEDSVLPTGAATSANQATEITDLETMMLYDRGLSKVLNLYNAFLAAHGATVRYTYIVPGNKIALLEGIWVRLGIPDAGHIAEVQVKVNGIWIFVFDTDPTSLTYLSRMQTWSGAIWLPSGSILTVTTYSDSGTNVAFTVTTTLSEFNA
jgi:hypothetical protein